MVLSEIMALVNAGFTKDDISKLLTAAPDQEPAPAPEPTPAPVPEPAPEPTPAPAPAPAPAEDQQPSMADLMQSIAKLTSAVQANAIAHSVIPGGAQQPTAEDMLAEIIRPTFKERG